MKRQAAMGPLASLRASTGPAAGTPRRSIRGFLGAAPRRALWLAAAAVFVGLALVGLAIPLVPSCDCLGVALYCLCRASPRWKARLLTHDRIASLLQAWRRHRVLPLWAKLCTTLLMCSSCLWAAWTASTLLAWLTAACCLPVAAYLWSRPRRAPIVEDRC